MDHQHEQGQESRLEPSTDSNLGTPQADQRFPTADEQRQQAEARENELERARQDHNDRTGGGEVREGETQEARDEHNTRVNQAEGQQNQTAGESSGQTFDPDAEPEGVATGNADSDMTYDPAQPGGQVESGDENSGTLE